MEEWNRILIAFVNGDETYDFGTSSVQDVKVITPDGDIKIQKDERWEELIEIGKIFSGNEVPA
jgi:uncharacterized protein YaiE (UPF0345 family)